jgi:hypothetical protein
VFLPIAIAKGYVQRTAAEISHKVHTTKNKYVLPKFFYVQRLNLLSSTAEQEMLIRLRDKGEIPIEIIADVFGWDVEGLKAAFKREQGTELDQSWRKSRDEVVKDSSVQKQILKGTKIADLDIPEKETEVKKVPGRPTIPEEAKAKPETAIISPGPAEASPRKKLEEKEKLPAPKETEKAAVPPPTSPLEVK